MGLIKEGDDYIVLSDIAGVEDHLGDMDFKVAGTAGRHHRAPDGHQDHGRHVRHPARRARAGQGRAATFILGKMAEVIAEPREELSEYAPRITSIQIDTDKIGMVIGKGGETIRALSEEFEAQIDVHDDGTILRLRRRPARWATPSIDRIRSMTKEVEVGDEFTRQGRQDHDVRRVRRARPRAPTACCTSRTSRPASVPSRVEDVLNRGDEVDVRVVEVDKERGRIGLRLADDPEIAGKTAEELASVGTGDRGGDRGGDGRPRRVAAATVAAAARDGGGGGGGGRDRRSRHGDYRRDRR